VTLCALYKNGSSGCWPDAPGDENTRSSVAHLSYICQSSGTDCVPTTTINPAVMKACQEDKSFAVTSDTKLTLVEFFYQPSCLSARPSPIGHYATFERLTNSELCEWVATT
jgi:hypothetical protein